MMNNTELLPAVITVSRTCPIYYNVQLSLCGINDTMRIRSGSPMDVDAKIIVYEIKKWLRMHSAYIAKLDDKVGLNLEFE